MKRRILLALVLFGMASGVHAAATPAPLLALLDGGLGESSRLVALEPRTLQPRRGGLSLPGSAFGREWARSPDGDRIALVPKPSQTNERLFVIDTRGSLRVLAGLPLPGEDVCRLAWPSARRLVIVLTRGDGCYGAVWDARILVVDPLRARVVADRPLSGPTTFVATAPTRDGLALLLAPPGSRTGARLVLAGTAGTRSIRLPRLTARPRPLDKSMLGTAIGLAVDRKGGRVFLLEPRGRVIDVDLKSGEVRVRKVPLRAPAAAAKGATAPVVQVLSLPGSHLAVTGVLQWPRLVPLGVRLVDTRTGRSRLIDPEATGIAKAGTTLLAFQPFFRTGTSAIGLRGYTLAGSMRFSVLEGRPISAVRVQGRYAYAATGSALGGTTVVDLSDGRVEAPGPNAFAVSAFELLAGPL